MIKRVFDVVASFFGLLVLSPLLVFLGLVIKVTSPGPIFYRATRVGKDGKLFRLFKFRSMVIDADKIGPGITGGNDPRITRIGRILRRSKLDELPQLFNVLQGEMSIVGPRPEDPRYVALYTDEQRKVLSVRPGITSLASIEYRHEEKFLSTNNWEVIYTQDIMPAKLLIDSKYVQNSTLRQDIKIVVKTLKALFN